MASRTDASSTCSGGRGMSPCFGYACKVRAMLCLVLLLLAAALAVVYFLLVKTAGHPHSSLPFGNTPLWFPQCPGELLSPEQRFDCHPEGGSVDRGSCEARGCCYLGTGPDWNLTDAGGPEDGRVPTCVYPSNHGYEASGRAEASAEGFSVPLRRIPAPSRFGDDIQNVRLKVETQTAYRLRMKFYDAENARYEAPVPKIPVPHSSDPPQQGERKVPLYSLAYNTFSSPFSVKVRRSSSESVVFDTSLGAFVFSNQFLELTVKLSSSKVFGLGLGQSINNFHHEFKWNKVRLFSAKAKNGKFSSSIHPFFLCIEDDGNAFGVLLLNSNAMEVQFHPSNAITFRTLGGILDFYVFMGPTPIEVVQQYTEAIGRPAIPPYWSLGFHFGLEEYESTEQIETLLNFYQAKFIPVESLIVSQDIIQKYLSRQSNFQNFSDVSSQLLNKGQRLQVQFSSGVSKEDLLRRAELYNVGKLINVFVSDKWGLHPIAGKQNNKDVFYPDFGGSPGAVWWSHVIQKAASAVKIDGIWLADNEPWSDVHGSIGGCLSDDLNNPPYLPTSTNGLLENTLCMDTSVHWRGEALSFYDFHNLYGYAMTLATNHAFSVNDPKVRKLIVSDSTFVGNGRYSAHSIKGLDYSWQDLRSSVALALEQSIFGIAQLGIIQCGPEPKNVVSFRNELCLRWFQLGVFLPLLMLFGDSAKHFYNFTISNQEFTQAVRNAVSRRYELLPHLYTLFYLAQTNGSTVIRSLYHEFPNEPETYNITSQFMWGSSLLISPILEKGAKKLDFYLPKGVWYDYYQGSAVVSDGEWFQETGGPFYDSKQPVVLHIKAGSMLVLQKPADNTFLSRQNSMSLLVALDSSYHADGLLFWDDGEARDSHILGEYILVDFVASGTSFTVAGNFGKKAVWSNFYRTLIQQVRIMGLPKTPKRIIIDGSYILSNKQYYWNYDTKVLDLKHILIPLARQTKVEWVF